MGNNEAKQKAMELIEYFDELLTYRESKQNAKQCAIKVCDERAKLIVELSERGYWLDKIQEQIDIKKEIEKI
jgi:hypothetical protein